MVRWHCADGGSVVLVLCMAQEADMWAVGGEMGRAADSLLKAAETMEDTSPSNAVDYCLQVRCPQAAGGGGGQSGWGGMAALTGIWDGSRLLHVWLGRPWSCCAPRAVSRWT